MPDKNKPWSVNILSLFPEIFPGPLGLSVTGNGLKSAIWELNAYQIRDHALDKHKTVDDYAYGGGSGMVMKADVLARAIDNVFIPNELPIYYLSPRGKVFNQDVAREIVSAPGMNILCGRFEGIDERLFLEYKIVELSLGDFVLSSGDVAAIPIIDTCVRLLPGILEEKGALEEESFGDNEEYRYLLEYPHYTRPAEWRGHNVPDVLKSGHHEKINKWRLEQAKLKTEIVRPDLLDRCKNKGV
jgi:tRNA (guanine37-N1)-methyltransferase